jgi:Lon protease-like protein
MECHSDCGDEGLGAVPLFALPNVVLFPRAVLPLHIFEERYKTMTCDALADDGRIAMALLKPGWEKDYYQRPAIEPVVCVGKILSWERLADGKYNFLLQGMLRATIDGETAHAPYRVARLKAIRESSVMEIDLANDRQRLMELCCSQRLASTAVGRELKKILTSSLSTQEAADLIAYHMLDNVQLKQSLLAEANVCRRVKRVLGAMEAALPALEWSCGVHEPTPNCN